MSEYRITLEDPAAEEDVRAVVRGLVAYNDSRAEREEWKPLALFVRDGSSVLRGGLVGSTQWGWLYVSHLWVDDGLRGQGHGRELLRRAEAEAVARGCLHAHLDTFSFQARGFYEGLGYEVFGALDDYPPGHTRYHLRKRLLAAPSR
ncbi:MAG: GNAT family N-acetyltransferase [Gemmatimonadota bacterium]|nr:GNAT family N-acetyltransferase [Gemmatimonadota bacterium]